MGSSPMLQCVNLKNRVARRRWCQNNRFWGRERWHKVLFSDEAPFDLLGSRLRTFVKRKPNERYMYLPECLEPKQQNGGGKVHVWGCMSAKGVGELRILTRNVNSDYYVEILGKEMVESGRPLMNDYFVFQQDNAPAHKSKKSMGWLEDHDINVLPWPARSPNLNPIENLWRIMQSKVKKYNPENLEDLKMKIMDAWRSITPSSVEPLMMIFLVMYVMCITTLVVT